MRAEKAQAQGEQAIELAESVEGELKLELDLKEQELQLALAENHSLEDQLEQVTTELAALQLQVDFLEQAGPCADVNDQGYPAWDSRVDEEETSILLTRLLSGLRGLVGSERLRPRQCLELISEQLCPGSLLVLESAWASADQARGFEHSDQLFQLLWTLATEFRQQKLAGAPDLLAGRVFGTNSYAPRESQRIESNPKSRRERTFSYNGKTIEMWQHLKIGVKDSENRTLRIHFCWDSDLEKIVVGHCGKHLHIPNH